MPLISNIFTSLACLMAVTNAIPANIAARQPSNECATGTSFFHCGEHKGCFSKDPCVEPTPSKPSTPNKPDAECPSGSGQTVLTPSAIYNIFPKSPNVAQAAVSGVRLESYDGASQVEQVVVFSGIPAEAKTCSFGWKQGEKLDRIFIVRGSDGVSNVRQLSGFPEGKDVTYNSIKPFDDAEKNVGGIDFANWDDLDPATHGAGSVDCAETLYFKVSLRNGDSGTKVYLGQDENNGFDISYSC
ncbi:hypothetical protein CEP54_012252 [Fusarium duplospermum]|uniref:Ubiquitin 3 binding protein But2 C-terminal domain-containing protein n=1 Tax=Fusarium duplospermum TaxID=1325734 RepID=A0A428P9Z6_9HYPO|nr:hypothetical protein CEP54_012252 [Fusarium duplospermum]